MHQQFPTSLKKDSNMLAKIEVYLGTWWNNRTIVIEQFAKTMAFEN